MDSAIHHRPLRRFAPRMGAVDAPLLPLALLVLLNLLLHLLTNGVGAWGFHRDELLYLAMGDHLDWGFWSNPPLIGFFGWIAGWLPGEGPWTVRLIPAVLSSGTVLLTGLLAREIGGGRAAVTMAGLCALLTPSLLRVGMLFQPVVFDVLCWTSCAYLIVRYINTGQARWVWALGAVAGVGLLNKYSVAFFVLVVLLVLPLTPQRRLFTRPSLYGAAGVAFLLVLPNLIWQAAHDFPVITHMRELRSTQLVNVQALDFLLEQVLAHLPVALVWMLGLVFFFSKRGARYRLLGWIYLGVVLLMLVLGGKSYYTLGLYPMLFAAGARWLELHARRWMQGVFFAVATLLAAGLSPFAIPFLPVPTMVAYNEGFVQTTGIDAPLRWEDGRVHTLPQDYADMLGWEDLAALVADAYHTAPGEGRTGIYAENYGQAGAVSHFRSDLPDPVSYSDSYRLWAPDVLPSDLEALVVVGDVQGVQARTPFTTCRIAGTLDTPHARERGTRVYVCRRP